MRPAEIRVFDGLRITTDHLNHLQGAFASGFEDVREILGLGQPQIGLDVALQDDGSVTIQPGTAFDLQKNRVACDTPLNLKLTFGAQDKVKYICLKYEQVEDGIVESHPTMLWDSCSALVRDQYPVPAENLVTLARVVKRADGKLNVRPACGPEEIIEETEITPVTTQGTGGPTIAAPPPAPDTGSTVPANASAGAAAPATPATADADASSQAALQAPETPAPPVSPAAAAVRCSQGVIALVSDPGAASYLRTVLAPAIRNKAGASSIDLSFTLAQSDLAPGIAASGLSSQGVLSGDLLFPAAADSTQAPHYRFQSVFYGEAVPAAGALDQFGTSGINMTSVPTQPGAFWSTGDFTSGGMARFTFGAWSEAPSSVRPPFPDDVLAGLQLLVQMTPGDKGFQVVLKLQWSGQIAESSIQFLETQEIGFTWGISFGWKAIGS